MITRLFKRIKLKLFLWHTKTRLLKTYQEEVASYEKACFKICLKLKPTEINIYKILRV